MHLNWDLKDKYFQKTWTCEFLYSYLNIPMKYSLHNTPVWLYLNVSEFCYRSVPILRYFQNLIKPLFFNTWGHFISHAIACWLSIWAISSAAI